MGSKTIKQITATQTTLNKTDWVEIQEDAGTSKNAQIQAFIDAIYPVGSFYVQYPDAASNTDATAFPTSARPATMFGGTWVEQFNTEGIVFQTAGYDGAVGRSNGLHEDTLQGHLHDTANAWNPGITAFTNNTLSTARLAAYSIGSYTGANTGVPISDGTNGTPRTGTRTVHRNRLMKLWKRTVL